VVISPSLALQVAIPSLGRYACDASESRPGGPRSAPGRKSSRTTLLCASTRRQHNTTALCSELHSSAPSTSVPGKLPARSSSSSFLFEIQLIIIGSRLLGFSRWCDVQPLVVVEAMKAILLLSFAVGYVEGNSAHFASPRRIAFPTYEAG
jgi:hypothetical protein